MASGTQNGNWKGEEATYSAKHTWMRTNFGTPSFCEHCKTTENRRYHWANISGEYQRERSDWLRLCVPCHKRNDIKALGGKIRARAKKVQPSKICAECHVEFFKNPKLTKALWESARFCSKSCSAKVTGRKLKGTTQSDETKALKTQKLKERWATDTEWRESTTQRMMGNQYARKPN